MCLIVFAWQVHGDYPLIVAANRDEFFDRPTAACDYWPEAPAVLAGRDLEAGGSWLGIARDGRFAALTNFREGGKQQPKAPSRGPLVADYLTQSTDAEAYLASVAQRAQAYNGFNLLVGDGQRLGYLCNREEYKEYKEYKAREDYEDYEGHENSATHGDPGAPRWLPPGIYGLSNHRLDTPWPKLVSAKAAFTRALEGEPDRAALFNLLADREIVADPYLPATGVPQAWERILSAVFVASKDYGTRCSTVLLRHRDGKVRLSERRFGRDGVSLGESEFVFQSAEISTGV